MLNALDILGCAPSPRGDHIDARCPATGHADNSPSFSADWKPPTADKAGRMVFECKSSCSFHDIRAGLGFETRDFYDGVSPAFQRGSATSLPRPASPASVPASPAQRKPVQPPAAKPEPDHQHDYAEEARHVYADAQGTVLATIIRRRCTNEACTEKTFATHYPGRKKPAGAKRLVDWLGLYNLPAVTAAIASSETVYVVEGEGDADRLTALGAVATCNPTGAGKWRPQHTKHLTGAHVVIVADYDESGYKHALTVSTELAPVAASVRVVRGLVQIRKADVSDHLNAGHGLEALVPVAAADLQAGWPGVRCATGGAPTGPAPAKASTSDTDAVEDADDEQDAALPGRPVHGSDGWRFDPAEGVNGAIWKRQRGPKGSTVWRKSLYWCPKVTVRLVVLGEDGKVKDRYYEVTVGEDTIIVALSDLRAVDGWNTFADASGTGTKAMREVLVNIVEQQGLDLPRTLVVKRTGWHDLPGYGRTYVFADGRTLPEGRPVQVDKDKVRERVRKAAMPLEKTATMEECRKAVQEIAAHGWTGTFSVGTGARSMGFTLRPVTAGLAFFGERNSGKTSTGAVQRGLLFTKRPEAFPPEPTRAFHHTKTTIELAVAFEADSPLLIEDLALTLDSAPAEVREANDKLEMLFRSVGNDEEMRGRSTRKLGHQEASYVRGIPVATAQMMPPTMQASLYRRAVCIQMSENGGQLDWRWYRDGGGKLLEVPLRTIGEMVIQHLYEQGDEATEYLEDLDAKATTLLKPYVNKALPDYNGPMEGVIKAAGGMLAGILLIADVLDMDGEALARTVCGPLADSLAQQAEKMDDRHAAQDDLPTAVAAVIRNSLLRSKAHIRDAGGNVRPAVPHEVEQAQGLIYKGIGDNQQPVWEGRGSAFYWLPDRGPALGITSEHLHDLLQNSTDAKVKGTTSRSLPNALLRSGMTYRNATQKGREATWRVDIAGKKPWLILIKPEYLWDLGDDGDNPPPGDGTGDPGTNGDGSDDSTRPPADGDQTAPQDGTDTPDLPEVEQTLFGNTSGSEAEPSTNGTATDAIEEDDMPYQEQLAPCVVCGKPTPRREADGTPRHLNLPGVFSCNATPDGGGFLAAVPAAPAEANPLPASPVPVQQSAPAARERTARARTTPADSHGDAPVAEYPNGPLAVLDAASDGTLTAHLADGRTLVCAAKSINTLATWALGAGLGQARLHKWGTDADPMVVLTALAAAKLGLPPELEDRRQLRLPEDHKVVKALTKAGWQLTKRGFSAWTRLYKPVKDGNRQCVQLAVMPWDALGSSNGWAIDPDATAADVARTLGTYATRVIAPRGSMGTNSIELLLQLRPATRAVWSEDEQRYVSGPVPGSFTRAVQPAPPEAPMEHPLAQGRDEETDAMREEAWNWHRSVADDEAGFPCVVGIDTNTSFLAAASRLLVGDGDPVHQVKPTFDKKTPGAWRADLSGVEWDPRFPCPLTPDGKPPTGPGWYTTQTLAYAAELGLAVEPSEGWLRRPAVAAWLDPWQEHLARAYKDTMAALGIVPGMAPEEFLAAMEAYNQGTGDPVERALARYIKQTVKSGIGKLRQSPARYLGYTPGRPWPELEKLWWRPDVRAAVISTARVSQHRKMLKTYQATGLAPLAAYSDCVIYPAAEATALAVIPRTPNGGQLPGAFRLGVQPGWCKQEGARPLTWYTERQTEGVNPARYVAPRANERDTEGE
ncbi:hypothetical protein [Kitasatospora sp. NPDC047058]|uniref:telomere-associated protein Tap n=1 Tax=Kitasatospora sp. NPDC047058 TaxID=3155620 RepID=UPI003409AB5B